MFDSGPQSNISRVPPSNPFLLNPARGNREKGRGEAKIHKNRGPREPS